MDIIDNLSFKVYTKLKIKENKLAVANKRTENEKKFGYWIEFSDGGRRYFYEIKGKYGWFARYIKDVNNLEQTIKFYQEIYDQNGNLVEIHVKYPEDKGHKKI